MTYKECVECIDGVLSSLELADIGDCCLQFNVIGNDSGVFYIDIRDHVARLTEDSYREYKVKYVFTVPVLSRLLRRVVDPMYAYTTSKYKMMGDVSLGRCILVKLCEASA